VPILIDKKFREVPEDGASLLICEILPERMRSSSIDANFGEEIVSDAVGRRHVRFYLRVGSRLLVLELVAGKREDAKTRT